MYKEPKIRVSNTYLTRPKLESYKKQGFEMVKEYDTYCLFQKVVNGVPIYKECFHKFDLYGAEWARAKPALTTVIGWRKGEPNFKRSGM